MMNDILIGNLCSLCAIITDSFSGTRKKRSEILGIQIISSVFYSAGTIVLKGYSSTVQSAVAILRNLAAIKNVRSKAVEWTLILLGVVLGFLFNNRGLIGWLPIIANLEYSIAVFRFKDDERRLKIAFIINMLMFFVFGISIKNYVAAVGNIVVTVTTLISLLKTAKSSPDA